jgi:hypothetical protein
MDEEELKRLSGRTFGSSPTFPSNMFANAAKTPAYDTQTRKLVGSDFSPSRQPYGKPISMAIPSFTAPLPTGLSPAAVGQNLVTQPQSAISSTNPTVPDFPIEGMGLMSNQNIRPLPTEQISPMTRFEPTLEDRGKITTDIVGMQGKTPMQTPYGTVYATAGQMGSERVSEMGGLPAQSARLENIGERARQSAAVKQMRERGAELGQQGIQRQEQFFAQKRAERDALRVAEGAARSSGVRPMDIMRAREGVQGPSTMAGIRRDFESYQPQIGPMVPTSTLVANAVSGFAGGLPEGGSRPLSSGPMGPSGYALYEQQQAQRRAGGATGPYSNVRAEQRRRTRDIARSQGMQPAYSRPVQEEQEDYFRRRGLM